MAKAKVMPRMRVVPGSVRTKPDNDLYLYRPMMGDERPAGFERLACGACGGVTFEIDRTGDGWAVECADCGDAASMLSALMEIP